MANAYQVLSRCCWNNAAILGAVLKLVILSIVKCSKAQLLQHAPASVTWSANVPQINGYCLLQRKACLGMNQVRARLYSWYLCDCHRRLHCSTPTLVTHIVTWAWAPKSPIELPQSTSDLYTESKRLNCPERETRNMYWVQFSLSLTSFTTFSFASHSVILLSLCRYQIVTTFLPGKLICSSSFFTLLVALVNWFGSLLVSNMSCHCGFVESRQLPLCVVRPIWRWCLLQMRQSLTNQMRDLLVNSANWKVLWLGGYSSSSTIYHKNNGKHQTVPQEMHDWISSKASSEVPKKQRGPMRDAFTNLPFQISP